MWAAESQALKDKAEEAKRQAAEDATAAKRTEEYAARAEAACSRAAQGEAAPRPAPPRRHPSPELERYRPRAASEVRGALITPCSGKVHCITPKQVECPGAASQVCIVSRRYQALLLKLLGAGCPVPTSTQEAPCATAAALRSADSLRLAHFLICTLAFKVSFAHFLQGTVHEWAAPI